METATNEHQIEPDAQRDAELATLYGGLDEAEGPYPLLIQPWEGEVWDDDSELDPQIFAGLLRLAP
jgi:hypothetical protein